MLFSRTSILNGCGFPNPYDLSDAQTVYYGSNIKDFAGTTLGFGSLLPTGDTLVIASPGYDTTQLDSGAV